MNMNGCDQTPKQQQSIYRKYFIPIDGKKDRMRCLECCAEIASRKASNLQTHLQNIHKDLYATLSNNPSCSQVLDISGNAEQPVENAFGNSSSIASTSSDVPDNGCINPNKTLVLSERSRNKLIFRGFGYIFDKTSTDKHINFWRCERKSLGCMARMHTVATTNDFIRLMSEHNHDSKTSKVYKQNVINTIKASTTQNIQMRDDVEESIRRLTNSILNRLRNDHPNARKRNRSSSPSTSKRRKQLEIPDEYKFFNNERFLLADSFDYQADGSGNALIFGRKNNNFPASQAKHIYFEVLCSNLPDPFNILCVLWIECSAETKRAQLYPLIYALLEEDGDFKWMLKMMNELWPELNPDSVTIDLPKTNSLLLNIAHDHFNNSAIHLSFLSMSQLLKQFLMETFDNIEDDELQQKCRLFLALAFVPPSNIQIAFKELSGHLFNSYPAVLEWFESEFIGKTVHKNHRRRPTISQEVWTCYQRFINGETLSNQNAGLIERQIVSKFEVNKRPELNEWIEALRQFQYFIDLQTDQFAIGVPLDYNLEPEYDERLFKVVNGFTNETNLLDFLYDVEQNLRIL